MRGERSAAGHAVTSDLPSAPLHIWGEPAALARIVGNLLDNAVKYGGEAAVSVSQAASEAIMLVDSEDRVQRINREFSRIFGYLSSEIVGGISTAFIVPPDALKEARASRTRLAQGESVSMETVRRCKDGSDISGCQFLTNFGFRARLRLGEEMGTHLVLGAGFTANVGTLLEAAYHWLPKPVVPVQLTVQVTDMPVPEDFGVRLNVTPSILGNGAIHAKITPEISDLDYTNAVVESGFVIPALKVSTLSTDIITQPGESIIMGGLVRRIDTRTYNKIPLLGDIPVLGKLFQSVAYQSQHTDVVFVMTPEVITR